MYKGTITRVCRDRGFGFIATPDQPDVFFHFSDLGEGLEFGEHLQELRVKFDIISTNKGSRASNIQPAAD